MERISFLNQPDLERALRRFILAQNLFDQACYSVLDAEGQITPVAAILSSVDGEMAEATEKLEAAIHDIVTARVDEALKVARLLMPDPLPEAA